MQTRDRTTSIFSLVSLRPSVPSRQCREQCPNTCAHLWLLRPSKCVNIRKNTILLREGRSSFVDFCTKARKHSAITTKNTKLSPKSNLDQVKNLLLEKVVENSPNRLVISKR